MPDPIVDPAATPTPQSTDPAVPAVPATPQGGEPTPAPAADPAPAPATPAASDWPDDWRNKYSDDPKVLKRLERYASPVAALDALFAAQAKISSGDLKSVLKPDASPEEVASWREDNGIPASPADYELSLPSGRIIGEADKPIVDEFLASAHEANMHPNQVNKALDWYMTKQETVQQEQMARDEETRMSAMEQLREEFGPDLKRNVMLAKESVPEDIRDEFMGGRLADGTLIGDNPVVIRWLANVARELNPIATVAPGSGTNAVQAVDNEIASLKAMMGDRQGEYWKGPKASQLQARYRDLVSAKERTR